MFSAAGNGSRPILRRLRSTERRLASGRTAPPVRTDHSRWHGCKAGFMGCRRHCSSKTAAPDISSRCETYCDRVCFSCRGSVRPTHQRHHPRSFRRYHRPRHSRAEHRQHRRRRSQRHHYRFRNGARHSDHGPDPNNDDASPGSGRDNADRIHSLEPRLATGAHPAQALQAPQQRERPLH